MEKNEIIKSQDTQEINNLRKKLEDLDKKYSLCDFNDDPKDIEKVQRIVQEMKVVCKELLEANRRDIIIEILGDVPDWI